MAQILGQYGADQTHRLRHDRRAGLAGKGGALVDGIGRIGIEIGQRSRRHGQDQRGKDGEGASVQNHAFLIWIFRLKPVRRIMGRKPRPALPVTIAARPRQCKRDWQSDETRGGCFRQSGCNPKNTCSLFPLRTGFICPKRLAAIASEESNRHAAFVKRSRKSFFLQRHDLGGSTPSAICKRT